MIVAVDFDETIVRPVDHNNPSSWVEVEGAFKWMKQLQEAGLKLILWTVRTNRPDGKNMLEQAVHYCKERGVEFYAVNKIPTRPEDWRSPKIKACIFIDDRAVGCPLLPDGVVDWETAGPAALRLLEAKA